MKLVGVLICAVFLVNSVHGKTEEELMNEMGGYSQEKIAEYMKVKETCITETGVDRQLVDNAEKGIVSIDEKLACFGACMLKKFGVMREDGSIDEDEAIRQIPPAVDQARAIEVFHKCKKVRAKNHCVKAGLIGRCIIAHKKYVITGEM